MSDKSNINWTDATWNPATGCTKVSAACKFCYAERDWARLAANQKTVYYNRKFTDVMCHPERLDQPLRWTRQRKIFVNSMSDLFHMDVPEAFIDQVFAVMGLSYVMRKRPHVFQVLTKRPDRMQSYLSNPDTAWRVTRAMKAMGPGLPGENSPPTWPLPNVWVGVSVEDQSAADDRVPLLLDTPAAVRFLSCEPLLGAIDLTAHLWGRARPCVECPKDADCDCGLLPRLEMPDEPALHQVIIGGESGSKSRPMHPDWARSLRDQCKSAGVPFWFKQWGAWMPHTDRLGGISFLLPSGLSGDQGDYWEGRAAAMRKTGKNEKDDVLDGEQWFEWPFATKSAGDHA